MTAPSDFDPQPLIAEAERSLANGNVDAAVEKYRQLVARFPDNAQLHEALGRAEWKRGGVTEAAAAFKRALQIAPNRPQGWRLLGAACLEMGLDEALGCFDAAIALAPAEAEGYYDRAVACLRLNRPGEAAAACDRALTLRPDYAEALVNRGTAWLALNRAEAAAADYTQALRQSADLIEALAGRSNALRRLKRYDEALADIEKAVALSPDDAGLHFNRGNILLDQERFSEAVSAFDEALIRAPNHAPSRNNRANALRALNRLNEALDDLKAAVAGNPADAQVWNNLGGVQTAQHRPADAVTSFERALQIAPAYAAAHAGLGIALMALDRPGEALPHFEAARQLEPDNPEHVSNRGSALIAMNRPSEALPDFTEAVRLSSDDPVYVWNRAQALLTVGDYTQGWPLYESRWQRGAMRGLRRRYPQPPWQGQDLRGKTIYVYAEQGLGDTLQFCRYLPLLAARGANVTFEAPRSLHRILAALHGDVRVVAPGQPPPIFSYHAPLMSLPLAFSTTMQTVPNVVPYLSADPKTCQIWRKKLGPECAPRIGLVVAGRPEHENDRNRSLPLETLAPLISGPFEFHLLQRDIRPRDVGFLAGRADIITHTDDIADFADTAALIDEMDQVVSVDTSVAHLAGAMGKPLTILLPFAADWRWLIDRSDSPWYPTARLLRQSAIGDWTNVVEMLSTSLNRNPAAAKSHSAEVCVTEPFDTSEC